MLYNSSLYKYTFNLVCVSGTWWKTLMIDMLKWLEASIVGVALCQMSLCVLVTNPSALKIICLPAVSLLTDEAQDKVHICYRRPNHIREQDDWLFKHPCMECRQFERTVLCKTSIWVTCGGGLWLLGVWKLAWKLAANTREVLVKFALTDI